MRTSPSRSLGALIGAALLLAGCKGPSADLPKDAPPHIVAMEQAAAAKSALVGQPAPDFALPDQDENEVSLAGLRPSWVVLHFYAREDTPDCDCDATKFTRMLAQFGKMNAKIVGISVHRPDNNEAFRRRFKIGIDLLSDREHQVIERYGLWSMATTAPDHPPVGQVGRSTLIVDPRGVIRHHWPLVIPEGHVARVRQKLAELQAAAAS